MQEHLIELSVGQTLHVGHLRVTVLQIKGDELCLQIDGEDGGYEDLVPCGAGAEDSWAS